MLREKNAFCTFPGSSSVSEGAKKFQKNPRMSVKFVSAILGPEMAYAPILWTPGKMRFLSAGKPMSIKFRVLGGGGVGGGGGKCRFYFYGREDFSESCRNFSAVHFLI